MSEDNLIIPDDITNENSSIWTGELTGYYDSNAIEYRVGDIVYNPFYNDVWVVEKVNDDSTYETPYILCLWGNEEIYATEIDGPAGFQIISRAGSPNYQHNLEYVNEWSKSHY